MYDLKDYYYELPDSSIAQQPLDNRDESRLLVVDCRTDRLADKHFEDIVDYFKPGDLLVVNDTKVFPARLLGHKQTGGRVELFVLEYPRISSVDQFSAGEDENEQSVPVVGLLKSSKRPKLGSRLVFTDELYGEVEEFMTDGKVMVTLHYKGDFGNILDSVGLIPLPPYIKRNSGEIAEDRQRYQTVYARKKGAVAAPTAGLHFSEKLLALIEAKKVGLASVTLHVGYGTFAPVREEDIRQHRIHSEYFEVSQETADLINKTKAAGGTLWTVGTTTVRALESAADEDGVVHARSGECQLYIYPGYKFRVVRNLITNFHLPGSSLLFLVSALAGRERIMRGYEHAVRSDYRFYSYGDAMVIIV
ncbi:MAG: tRNA preQ1(34) S-adenosylmethionine ribosyltransferase-isomerase QueA [Proteobacteria bacterium]|nr:tRNA preQ1(34) S-adenosylmethionine ribosyltransferase-isomerase QueA [Pseudomonadota bacterium]MBU1714424.1 tRNA preQ1(34) S-adenosylmethionine ribosyltransferase-isomerase QueA [Pseudomonadota bacterium]